MYFTISSENYRFFFFLSLILDFISSCLDEETAGRLVSHRMSRNSKYIRTAREPMIDYTPSSSSLLSFFNFFPQVRVTKTTANVADGPEPYLV